MSNKDIDLEKVRNRFSELFSKQNLEALREAEEKDTTYHSSANLYIVTKKEV